MNEKSVIIDYRDFTCQEEIMGNNPSTKWIGHFLVGFYKVNKTLLKIKECGQERGFELGFHLREY